MSVRLALAGPPPRAVVFDFDGVILESAEIKTHAFELLFADHPRHLDRILEHHHRNLGHSRYRKFEWIHRELLGVELTPEASRRLGERYSDLVLESARAAPLVPGARELLEALAGRIPAFVASGTPQEELDLLVDHHGLRRYFREVHGSPRTKEEILRDLLARYALEPERVVFVGDGLSDERAARATGLRFVARLTSQSRLADRPVDKVTDLSELLAAEGS